MPELDSPATALDLPALDLASCRDAVAHWASLRIRAFGSSTTEAIGASAPVAGYAAAMSAAMRARVPAVELRNRGIGGNNAIDLHAHPPFLASVHRIGEELGIPVFPRYRLTQGWCDMPGMSRDRLSPDGLHMGDHGYALLGRALSGWLMSDLATIS